MPLDNARRVTTMAVEALMEQIRWTVTLPHDRWLMVGEHGCSPRNATAEDVTLAGYVPAADLAGFRVALDLAQSRATAAETAQGARSDEVCRYITAFCAGGSACCHGPMSADEQAAVDAVCSMSNRATAAERRVVELDGLLASSHDETRSAERERDEAKKRAAESESTAYEKRQRWQDRALDAEIASDSLRAKLAEAEKARGGWRNASDEQIALSTAQASRLTRYAALESAARKNVASYSNDDEPPQSVCDLIAALDALSAPAPSDAETFAVPMRDVTPKGDTVCGPIEPTLVTVTAAPAAPKPETCGDDDEDCDAGGYVCEPCANNTPDLCKPDTDDNGKCRNFTRRLPVVEKTCGGCEHLAPRLAAGRSRECLIPHISATDSARESSPACPAFAPGAAVADTFCEGCSAPMASTDGWRFDGEHAVWTCPKCAAGLDAEQSTTVASKPETCGDASSTLNPGLACPQPKGHEGPCGNGRQMWWPKPAPAAPKPETCGECADAGTNRCEAPGRKGYDKACSKGTRRLPVVAEKTARLIPVPLQIQVGEEDWRLVATGECGNTEPCPRFSQCRDCPEWSSIPEEGANEGVCCFGDSPHNGFGRRGDEPTCFDFDGSAPHPAAQDVGNG